MASNAGVKPPRGGPASEADRDSAAGGRRPGPWPPRIEPLPADHGHNPEVLKSWARRTGYKSTASGETATSSNSDAEIRIADNSLPKPPSQLRPKDPDKATTQGNVQTVQKNVPKVPSQLRPKDPDKATTQGNVQTVQGNAPKASPRPKATKVVSVDAPSTLLPPAAVDRKAPEHDQHGVTHQIRMEPHRGFKDSEADMLSQPLDAEDVLYARQSHMKYEIRENPGIVPLMFYGFQHYLSMAGSIILIPLVIVPAMGGSDEDTAHVVSTVLLVTGLATLLQTFLGSRLPLIQGPSFVYLAPALVIINSKDLQSISDNRFKHTMRELQGAIIISSAFQALLGYSGLMSILLRLVNPVIVTPTVAAVGLAFFTYGFPVAGTCIEIGIPQILLIVFFALYLRKISILGHRIFQIYAVPLGLGVAWAYAFLLTEAGAYNYKDCSVQNVHVPMSNIISTECRKHVSRMMHCRTDVSLAMRTAAWFRFPYPFQWGIPGFHWKTACLMVIASIIATVDSVGSYHATSLLVAARAPTPGVVSRAIGLEGLTSALAGVWGIGTGASTLTENVHTIAVTKMGSRRAVEFGACVLILMSFVGKIGAFIASIPQVIVAAVLCIMWTLLTAFGLSNLRYSETGSSRNVIIVGLSLFLSLSVPVYFQRYAAGLFPVTVASYFQPYTVAGYGPIRTGIEDVDFVLNGALSMNMVIAFLVAFFLDNTVPGSRHERGTYVWSKSKAARREPAVVKDYSLPPRLAKCFRWVRWVGL